MAIESGMDEVDKKKLDPARRDYDPFAVHGKKEGYRYRLLNKNDRNIEKKKWEGWEIVQGSGERLGLDESTPLKKGADVDGTQRFNDVILARMPEAKYQERVRRNEERIKQLEQGAARTFRSAVPGSYEEKGQGSYVGEMTQSQFDASMASSKGKG